MISNLINRPCVILRRSDGDEDAHGNPEREETPVATVCEIQQKRRDEPVGEGELSVTDWDVFFPPGTAARTGDGLLVDGMEYEFVGDPWTARSPRTQADHHVEATVRRTVDTGDLS